MGRTIVLLFICTIFCQVAWGHLAYELKDLQSIREHLDAVLESVVELKKTVKEANGTQGAPNDTAACDQFANDIGLAEDTLNNGFKTIEGIINTYTNLMGQFPQCIVLDPFKTMKCFIETGKKVKDETESTKTILDLMKDTMDSLWEQIRTDAKACFDK